jgi:SAM-dependent methyltransferase
MSSPPHSPDDLERIYKNRFEEHLVYRNQVWRVLTAKYFSKLIPSDARVLDLGCGYGEFINNIVCAEKLAMDMNPAARGNLSKDVHFLEQDCSRQWDLPADHLDVVFTSNFFEHLPSKTALSDTLSQAARCLKDGGKLIAMGPNVRLVGGAYWDFWDHHLPLTHETMSEALRLHGFRILAAIPRFLPYTMVNRRPIPVIFVNLYLEIPLAWRLFGKQFLVVAQKTARH